MPIIFYPSEDNLETSSIPEKLEILMESAEQYKAFVLDMRSKTYAENENKKRVTPKDMTASFNWQEIAKLLRSIRELPEISRANKLTKAEYMTKLADVYEVLRGAKMAKLEAVRIALMNEANQLRSSAQVA